MPKPIIKRPAKLANGSYRVTVVRSDGSEEPRTFSTLPAAEQAVSALEALVSWVLPADDSGPVTNIVGPHRDNTTGRLVLRWQEGGQQRAKTTTMTAANRVELLGLRASLMLRAGRTVMRVPKLRGFQGRPKDIHKGLVQLQKAINAAALDGDMTEVEALRKVQRAYIEAAEAFRSLGLIQELQEQLDKATQTIEDLYAGRRTVSDGDGAVRKSLAATLQGRN